MNCCDCKSPNMGVSEITLKNKSTHKVIYCLDCGKVQNKVSVETEPAAPRQHKSWADRKAEADANGLKYVPWKERKERKQTISTATTTPAPTHVSGVPTKPFSLKQTQADEAQPF